MTAIEREHVEAALHYIRDLPTGTCPDEDAVDENDTSPEDAVFFLGSLAERELLKALGKWEK